MINLNICKMIQRKKLNNFLKKIKIMIKQKTKYKKWNKQLNNINIKIEMKQNIYMNVVSLHINIKQKAL